MYNNVQFFAESAVAHLGIETVPNPHHEGVMKQI